MKGKQYVSYLIQKDAEQSDSFVIILTIMLLSWFYFFFVKNGTNKCKKWKLTHTKMSKSISYHRKQDANNKSNIVFLAFYKLITDGTANFDRFILDF